MLTQHNHLTVSIENDDNANQQSFAKNNSKELNLTKLEPNQAKFIAQWLKERAIENIKGKYINYHEVFEIDGEPYHLSHNILIRPCHYQSLAETDPKQLDYHYYVVDEETVGIGSSAIVKCSIGKLVIDEDEAAQFSPKKEVVKIISHDNFANFSDDEEIESIERSMDDEYIENYLSDEVSNSSYHLSVKSATDEADHTTYYIMKFLQGTLVKDLVETSTTENNADDLITKVNSAIAMIESFYYQTFRQNIFHGDPHSGNCIGQFKNTQFNFFDYGTSVKVDHVNNYLNKKIIIKIDGIIHTLNAPLELKRLAFLIKLIFTGNELSNQKAFDQYIDARTISAQHKNQIKNAIAQLENNENLTNCNDTLAQVMMILEDVHHQLKLEQAGKSNHQDLNIAHCEASKVKATIIHENILTLNMAQHLFDLIDLERIVDQPAVIAQLVQTLNFKSLAGVQDKKSFKNKINQIYSSYLNETTQLQKIDQEVSTLLNFLPHDLNLQKLQNRITIAKETIIDKINLIHFDDLPIQTLKLSRQIQKITTELQLLKGNAARKRQNFELK